MSYVHKMLSCGALGGVASPARNTCFAAPSFEREIVFAQPEDGVKLLSSMPTAVNRACMRDASNAMEGCY